MFHQSLPIDVAVAGIRSVGGRLRGCSRTGRRRSLGIHCGPRDGRASWPHLSGVSVPLEAVVAMATGGYGVPRASASGRPASPARGHMNDRDNTVPDDVTISRSTTSCHADARAPAGINPADPPVRHLAPQSYPIRPQCNLKPRPAGEDRGVATAALRSTDQAAGIASSFATAAARAPCWRLEDRRMGLSVAVRVFQRAPAGRPGRGAGHIQFRSEIALFARLVLVR